MTQSPLSIVHTDLYELTMACGYWKLGLHEQRATFHLFFRKEPFHGHFAMAAGLESVIELLDGFSISASDQDYLRSLRTVRDTPLFDSEFVAALGSMRFTCDVDAIEEGRICFAHQPLVRVEGPLWQAQLLESILLNLINFQTLIATKAARVRLAAGSDEIMEFGLRRAQGVDGGLTASRAAYLGGCDGTSNVLAGKQYGIPVKGTHAHSWVMVFDDELTSFESYAEVMPDNCILLVDTYDTHTGVERAIKVGKEMEKRGKRLLGIRLDSGDLLELSLQSRRQLDCAGLPYVKIVASNELDEERIAALKAASAPITVWGVGTRLVTGHPQAALGGVYKLGLIDGKVKMKTAEEVAKRSEPGSLQVRRYLDKQGRPIGDVTYNIQEPLDESLTAIKGRDRRHFSSTHFEQLLKPIYRGGRRVYEVPALSVVRERALNELHSFPQGAEGYFRGTEESLYLAKEALCGSSVT